MPIQTNQLLEYWNLDNALLAAEVARLVPGPHDLLYGGSLADNLGSIRSDIDLYCFHTASEPARGHPLVLACGEAEVELHVIDIDSALATMPDLRPLITSEVPPPSNQWPLLSADTLRVFYALYCDSRISGDGSIIERLRSNTGSDLLHVYVALRGAATAAALLDDVPTLGLPEYVWTSLYCARLAVEAALDAALASKGLVSPNRKWRILLAERATLDHTEFPNMKTILSALFCGDAQPAESISLCLSVARQCMRVVGRDDLLVAFPAVRRACDDFEAVPIGGEQVMGSPLWT